MRPILRLHFLKSDVRKDLVGGQTNAAAAFSGEIQLTQQQIFQGGVTLALSQWTGELVESQVEVLPCPGFDVLARDRNPVRESSEIGAYIAAAAERVNDREVRLVYDVLTDAERAAIEAVWAGGDGMFVPFSFTVPGEAVARRFVFANDRFDVERRSARSSRVEIRLLDVGTVAD